MGKVRGDRRGKNGWEWVDEWPVGAIHEFPHLRMRCEVQVPWLELGQHMAHIKCIDMDIEERKTLVLVPRYLLNSEDCGEVLDVLAYLLFQIKV